MAFQDIFDGFTLPANPIGDIGLRFADTRKNIGSRPFVGAEYVRS